MIYIKLCILLVLVILLIILLISCTRYKVINEVRENLYHMYDPKTKKSEVILTKDSLTKGEFYRLRKINIIDSPYYERPKLIKR